MLPPVLEIYILWHPEDLGGQTAAEQFVGHFHGTTFSGLVGGAIEIYTRSAAWASDADAPRPIPMPGEPPPNGVAQAQLTAVVPVLGNRMAQAVEAGGPWQNYMSHIADAEAGAPDRVGIFPLLLEPTATYGTQLGAICNRIQRIAAPAPGSPREDEAGLRCRDLAQGIARLGSLPSERFTVFISHTKHDAPDGDEDVIGLVNQVREVISSTRLADFFDAHDLLPGQDWDAVLQDRAANGALLALRTDLYASREWCQRELSIAKRHGLPVVILDSLNQGEERGSYLMDHVARIPVHREGTGWSRPGILRCLNLIVDEALKRVLWHRQEALAQGVPDLNVSWWAPHAPELMTLAEWLQENQSTNRIPADGSPLRVLHPDPPLGPEELRVLNQLLTVAGIPNQLEVVTPRLVAARGI